MSSLKIFEIRRCKLVNVQLDGFRTCEDMSGQLAAYIETWQSVELQSLLEADTNNNYNSMNHLGPQGCFLSLINFKHYRLNYACC